MPTQQTKAIEVRDLVKVYPKKNAEPLRAVDGISFQVRRGEIFGLLGPNGAGKSTTLKVLTTLLPPTSGTATLFGYDVLRQSLDVRRQICVVVQESAVEQFLSVRNNFMTFGRFHGLTRGETETRMTRVIEHFGLREYLADKAIDLSGGLKRRVQVAKMFLVDKPIVFLDEATTGMDTFNKRATLTAIKEEATRGRTIVLTTHMLDEAEELCNSVAIINHGKVVASGSMQKVKSMGLRLYSLSLEFKKITESVTRAINKWKPVKVEFKETLAEVTLRDQETALKIIASLKKTGQLLYFEITSASLEDVFVELVDKKEK